MQPHVHLNTIHIMAGILATVIIFGTLHYAALLADNRASRAWIALGF